jgi:protein SCO1/2
LTSRDRPGLLGAVAVLGAVLLAGCTAAASAPPAPSANQGIVQDRPIPSGIPLITTAGTTTTLGAFRGKYIVMAPFLTLCQDECPLVTGAFIALQRDVAAAGLSKKVVFMEITVDPGRDTPARLAAYSQRFGADWTLLTGTPADLDALWKHFGISVQIVPEAQPPKIDWYTGKPLTYDVDHTDGYILIDRSGRERFSDSNPPHLSHLDGALTGLLNAGGLRNLTHPSRPNWTLSEALASLSWLVGRNIPAVAST